jgi:hypothetical protein
METFVVRVWRPGGEVAGSAPATGTSGHDVLRGVVEHPTSGNFRPFDSGVHLIEIIAQWRHEEIVEPTRSAPRER